MAKRFLSIEAIAKLLLALTIASFVTAFLWTEINPRQSYFLLPSRMCELLVGAMAYFYPLSTLKEKLLSRTGSNPSAASTTSLESALNKSSAESSVSGASPSKLDIVFSAKFAERLGLALIVISLFTIDEKNGWPTAWLLLPMLGSYLCVAANNPDTCLKNVVFQKLGIWSYAIYLVHWPIIVFASMLGLSGYGFFWLIPILLAGIALHYAVERRRNYGKYFTVAYFALALAVYVVDAHKLIFRVNAVSTDIFVTEGNKGFHSDRTTIVGDNPELIVHGDSHSLDLLKPIIARDYSLIINSHRGCYSLGNHVNPNMEITGRYSEYTNECKVLYKKLTELAKIYPDIPIVIQFNWPIYAGEDDIFEVKNFEPYHQVLQEDLMQVAKDMPEHKVYIMGARQWNRYHLTGEVAKQTMLRLWVRTILSTLNSVPKTITYKPLDANDSLKQAIATVNEHRTKGAPLAELIFVDPDVHCSNGTCNLFIDDKYEIYSDPNHLTWAGAEKVITHLLDVMKISKGQERTDFTKVPNIDFYGIQKDMPYSEQDGFTLP